MRRDPHRDVLGIFGAGNVGAAVTKFVAPFIMVAYGWKMVADVWALAIAVMAIVFWLCTKDDPQLEARRRSGIKPEPLSSMLEPLKSIQVWRFSLYYFFVFGAFVALALWLPRYLIGVYGLDITTAGMLGAFYSVPASVFRICGGVLSDKYGARRIMYWTLGVSVAVSFILSYPPTEYIVQGIRGPMTFRLETGLVAFTVLVFVLGFFMSLGKGGGVQAHPRLLPTACRIGWRRRGSGRRSRRFRLADPVRAAQRSDGRLAKLLHGSDETFWNSTGRRIARQNLLISILALLLSFAVWMVWSVVVAKLPSIGFNYSTDQLFWLAALPGVSGATLRIFYSFMVPIFGGRLWTTLITWSLMIPALGIGMAVHEDVPYTPAWQETITGVPKERVIAVARQFARNAEKTEGRSTIILGAGLNHWYHMDMNYRGIINLVVMCGCVGKSGGGWAHYVGQEKLRPQTGWLPLAFALDWGATTSSHELNIILVRPHLPMEV
jgi:NNP family nitrate/nitrite transporter-like MFS transporter